MFSGKSRRSSARDGPVPSECCPGAASWQQPIAGCGRVQHLPTRFGAEIPAESTLAIYPFINVVMIVFL